MIQRIDFAPLDGITRAVYRRVWHKYFGGADRYFIPFFSPTDQHILTNRDRREVGPENNAGLPAVPQVMTCRAEDFLWAAELVADMGYSEVNLNLGCPSGTVTAKGKGAGFLAKPAELDRFFDQVFSRVTLPVSVKTRLGIADPAEFQPLMDIYDRTPSPASPSIPGYKRRNTGGRCTWRNLPRHWHGAGTPSATTATCGPWRRSGPWRPASRRWRLS